jgi:hypothetical protein
MVAVAAVSVTLGGYREAIRLKRNRDVFLVRAVWHAEAETYYRRLVSSSESSILAKRIEVRESAAGEVMSPVGEGNALLMTVGLRFGVPEGNSRQAEKEDHDRFRAAQGRVGAMADRRRVIIVDNLRRQLQYHQRRAEYHAALRQKYEEAAVHPWRRISMDPPKPK